MYRLIAFITVFILSLEALPYDLEKEPDAFILEAKEIKVFGKSNIYNPAIYRYKGRLILFFRYNPTKGSQNNEFGYVWLDNDLNPTTRAKRLDIIKLQNLPEKKQDLRVIQSGGKFWGLYSGYYLFNKVGKRRFTIVELHVDGDRVWVDTPVPLLNCPPLKFNRTEKNWVPFDFQGRLLLAYTINPHVILEPCLGTSEATVLDTTEGQFEWNYGEIRGGTPAVQIDKDRYLSIFHSSTDMRTKQSKGEKITHYFMGAYTFSTSPPFQVTAMSRKPLVAKGFYSGPTYKTWKKLRCVFPCGIVDDGETLLVSYGRDDNESWIIRIDKKGLLDSLE